MLLSITTEEGLHFFILHSSYAFGKCFFTDMWRIFIYYIQCILVWAVVMGSFIQDLRSLFTLYSVWVVLLHWFSLPFQSSISIYLTETEHSARLPNHKTNVTSVI